MHQQVPYRIGALLVCRGMITEAQLAEAVLAQRQFSPPKPLGCVLVEMGLITDRELKRCLKRQKCLRWYAALAAMISAPSAAFCQNVSIEDCPEYQHTQVAELDAEGFHQDSKGHFDNTTGTDVSTLSGSSAVTAAMKTAARLLWNQYTETDAKNSQFDFAVATSSKGYEMKMVMYF